MSRIQILNTAVQDAQNETNALEDILEDEYLRQKEAIEDEIEAVEDAIDEIRVAQEADNEDELAAAHNQAESAVDAAQDEMEKLQKEVGFVDSQTAAAIEDVEDAIEQIEDHLEDFPVPETRGEDDKEGPDDDDEPAAPDDLTIEVNEETKDAPDRFMTPFEIVKFFDYDPNEVVLYKARDIEDGSREGDQFLPKDEEIDLRELNRFAALPSETPYGAASDDSKDISHLENDAIVADINRLREEYDVDVREDPENFTRVIVRDWPIPSDVYTQETTDVMIRVPNDYPQTPPDWIYVDEELRVEGGGWPKKNNRDRLDEWQALSWHVNNLDQVQWVPYETDLKWYLDTFCDLRFRNGE